MAISLYNVITIIYNIYIKIVHLVLLGSGGFVAFFLAFRHDS